MVIKSKEMRWAGHVERMGEKINAYSVYVGKWYGKNYLIDLSVDGNII